jgi:iron complex transport system permease protein
MPLLTYRRLLRSVGAFALFALAAMLVAPMFGSERLNVPAVLAQWWRLAPGQPTPPEVFILLQIRLPRIVMGFLTGAALAMAGAVFQALLRNPLATPYTLGVSSGGACGAVLATLLPSYLPALAFTLGPLNYVQVAAFGGSLLAVALIYWLARAGSRVTTLELLLAGVTLGMIFSALILMVQYFASPNLLVEMNRWLIGGLTTNGWRDVGLTLPLLVPGLAALMLLARGLDQISFGEELAAGRGVNVARLQKQAFVFGSLAVAAVVSLAGPIGFVGLIVPHTVRRMIGPDHRVLLPCTALAGGGFLVLCDTFARTVLAPTELPVGIITALLGGPFFIYLLIRGRRTGKMWGSEE